MQSSASRTTVLILVALSIALLIPGIFMPVLMIRGVLTPEGIASVTPTLLEKGLNDETVATLKTMMNPAVVAFVEATGGDVRTVLIEKLGPQLTGALQQGAGEIVVYEQTRSIVGAVRRLYEVGSPLPATLILLFSVGVPLGKAALVVWALFMKGDHSRRATLSFVEAIAKWSMADVFVVALFITYLAAQASTAARGEAAPVVAFDASLGPGFYWFTAYCIFSLATQQFTARLARREAVRVPGA